MAAISLKSRAGASCLAIVAKSGKGVGAGLLEGFSAASKSVNDPQKQVGGALCLGEFGKRVDLSSD
jgi:hypothetical protein